jgi:hypothetical protein
MGFWWDLQFSQSVQGPPSLSGFSLVTRWPHAHVFPVTHKQVRVPMCIIMTRKHNLSVLVYFVSTAQLQGELISVEQLGNILADKKSALHEAGDCESSTPDIR